MAVLSYKKYSALLECKLDAEFYVPHWAFKLHDKADSDGCDYSFGVVVNLVELQRLSDTIAADATLPDKAPRDL